MFSLLESFTCTSLSDPLHVQLSLILSMYSFLWTCPFTALSDPVEVCTAFSDRVHVQVSITMSICTELSDPVHVQLSLTL